MGIQGESRFVILLRNKLKAIIPGSLFFKISDRYVKGLPDLWGCKTCKDCGKAKLILLEAKAKDGRLSKLQSVILTRFKKLGAFAEEVRDGEETATIERLKLW